MQVPVAVDLAPFVESSNAVDWYNFSSSASRNPYASKSRTATFALIQDGTGVYIGLIYGKVNTIGGNATLEMSCLESSDVNYCNDAGFVLYDDKSEVATEVRTNVFNITHRWGAQYTDGFMYGPITGDADIVFEWTESSNIDAFEFIYPVNDGDSQERIELGVVGDIIRIAMKL